MEETAKYRTTPHPHPPDLPSEKHLKYLSYQRAGIILAALRGTQQPSFRQMSSESMCIMPKKVPINVSWFTVSVIESRTHRPASQ